MWQPYNREDLKTKENVGKFYLLLTTSPLHRFIVAAVVERETPFSHHSDAYELTTHWFYSYGGRLCHSPTYISDEPLCYMELPPHTSNIYKEFIIKRID